MSHFTFGQRIVTGSTFIPAAKCLVRAKNTLGEGPIWDFRTQRLYWFDIKARRLWRLAADGGAQSHTLPGMCSVAALYPDGEDLLIVGETGLFRFNVETAAAHPIAKLDLPAGFRTNDGKTDPAGGVWWSAMDDEGGRRPGQVYRYAGGESRVMVEDIHIANSIAFSPDGERLYLSDSARKTLWAFPLDETGRPGPREVFATWSDGEPDGAASDAQGGLWVAVWGGWRIDHFGPSGRLIGSIPVPVSQPTSCAFGGPNLSTLYVTSARVGLHDDELDAQPLAGGLFALETETTGAPVPAFTG